MGKAAFPPPNKSDIAPVYGAQPASPFILLTVHAVCSRRQHPRVPAVHRPRIQRGWRLRHLPHRRRTSNCSLTSALIDCIAGGCAHRGCVAGRLLPRHEHHHFAVRLVVPPHQARLVVRVEEPAGLSKPLLTRARARRLQACRSVGGCLCGRHDRAAHVQRRTLGRRQGPQLVKSASLPLVLSVCHSRCSHIRGQLSLAVQSSWSCDAVRAICLYIRTFPRILSSLPPLLLRHGHRLRPFPPLLAAVPAPAPAPARADAARPFRSCSPAASLQRQCPIQQPANHARAIFTLLGHDPHAVHLLLHRTDKWPAELQHLLRLGKMTRK